MQNKMLYFLKNKIEHKDYLYRNSIERKQSGWKIHCYITRKLITEFGILEVKITKYYIKDGSKTKTKLFDNHELLKNNKYQRIDKTFKSDIKKLYLTGLSSYKITKYYGNFFSARSVINFVKNENFNNEKIDYLELAKDRKYVYLEADDGFHRERDSNKKVIKNRLRMLVLHLGFDSDTNKIIGKTVIVEKFASNKNNSKNNQQWADFLTAKIEDIYGKKLEIIVIGDGARWIKSIAKKLNAKYILDHFHMVQKGMKTLGYTLTKYRKNQKIFSYLESKLNQKIYHIYKQLINNFDIQGAIDLLAKLIKNDYKLNKSKITEIIKLKKYLMNNLVPKSVYEYENGYIGSHTETFMNHHLKSQIKRRFATFNYETIKKLMIFNQTDNLKYLFI
ncbi:Mbov_0401 family ICE element transposase-like protein [Candidatus Mycoplasma pogonae]